MPTRVGTERGVAEVLCRYFDILIIFFFLNLPSKVLRDVEKKIKGFSFTRTTMSEI